MDEIELKPCPFCGGEAVERGHNVVWIRCRECGAETKAWCSSEQAKEAWNRRADNG